MAKEQIMDAFTLTTPSQAKTPNPQLEIDLQIIKTWVDYLPYANPALAARELLKNIQILNQNLCPIKKRLQLLDCYKKGYWLLYQPLMGLIISPSIANKGRRNSPSLLLKSITRELAFGYKIVVNTQLNGTSQNGTNSLLHIALIQATQFLVLDITTAYVNQTKQSSHSWRELHILYLYAEKNGLEADSITEEQANRTCTFNLSQLYKQACLFALLDPYQCTKEELLSLLPYTKELAKKAHISPFLDDHPVNYIFTINLNSEAPPTSHTSSFPDTDTRYLRLLDTQQAAHALKEKSPLSDTTIASLVATNNHPKQIEFLFHSIAKHWYASPLRSAPRTHCTNNAWLSVGLGNISALLKETSNSRPNLSDFNTDTPESALIFCSQNNLSRAGVGLTEISLKNETLQVKQVIGIHIGNRYTPGKLSIGTVSWVKQQTTTTLSAGIRLFSNQPSHCSLLIIDSQDRQPQSAIIFKSNSKKGTAYQLLTPPKKYSPHQMVSLQFRGTTTKVVLEKQIPHSSLFDCFQISSTQK